MEQDVEASIGIMEAMLESAMEIGSFRNSSLYEHMEFKETSVEFKEELKKNLLEIFRDEETYGYLKNEKR